jgi:hypothetical protein
MSSSHRGEKKYIIKKARKFVLFFPVKNIDSLCQFLITLYENKCLTVSSYYFITKYIGKLAGNNL